MAQAALKIDTDFDSPVIHYEAKTRHDALQSVLNGESTTASHEHVISPFVHNGANHIIKNKPNLNIELYGFPYEVLEQASEQLRQAGISSQMANQAIAALEEYILNMGTDFSRAAKAKPLYVRFQVTDKEPKDLPDCEQSQATFLDGMRSYGGDSATMIRYMSIFGPKSTSSQGVDVDKMFASKNMGLFIFFGAPGNEGVKGFDGVDNALMNAAQGIGGGGGALSEEAMAEIIEMIQNGDMSPEALTLLESLAELSQLQEAMLTPDAVENADAKLSNLVNDISEQITQGVENGTIPSILISASIPQLIAVTQNPAFENILENTAIETLISDNDNLKEGEDTQTLMEKLNDLTELSAGDLHELIEMLSRIDGLPFEISDLLNQIDIDIDIDNLTPHALAELLSADGENTLAQAVQNLIVTLDNPEIQNLLPQEVLTQVTQFLSNHSDLVEAVATHIVVQGLESASENITPESLEVVEIQNIVEGLKAGTETLDTIDPTVIQAIAIDANSVTFAALDNVVSTVLSAQADNVVLNQGTVEALNTAAHVSDVSMNVQENLAVAIQSQDAATIVNIVSENPQLGISIPQTTQNNLQAIQVAQTQTQNQNVTKDITPNDKNIQIASTAKGITSANDNTSATGRDISNTTQSSIKESSNDQTTPKTPQQIVENKIEQDAMNPDKNIASAAQPKTQENPTKNPVIDTGNQPEEIKFESPCVDCGGGICPGCGTDFGDAVKQALSDNVYDNVSDYNSALNPIINEIKNDDNAPVIERPVIGSNEPEEVKFESPCVDCGGGICPGCGTDFGDAVIQAMNDNGIDMKKLENDMPERSEKIERKGLKADLG